MKNKGYEQIEAFDNDKQMSDAYFDLTGFDAKVFDFNNEDNFANKYNVVRNRNTVKFLGIWEEIHNPNFNSNEFVTFKTKAGLNNFNLTPKKWKTFFLIRVTRNGWWANRDYTL